MSNNKQSSIEYLIEQIQTNGIIMFNELGKKTKLFRLMNEEVFEKAKSMHKHEIIVTYNRGCINQTKSFNGKRLKMPDEYYNETFGGNNEQQ